MRLRVRRLHDRAILPTRHNPRDAGLDLFAIEDLAVRPGEILKVRTGIALQPGSLPGHPEGIVSLVWDKSGRAASGLKTMGGVIDESYTGELLVVVTNLNHGPVFEAIASGGRAEAARAVDLATVRVPYGKAIAQLLVQSVTLAEPVEVEELDPTDRGDRGFGSSDRMGG
ncbi:dUTP diphosphatase [Tautonia plasticadhaerens]|uniref:dUTP diphosphatase n=1 Tax=Tautonia plasticadhaerens TaxID=2527974 RepID=A0A518HB33_9BACT|nr:dUTP diphosphatase [Tautonia plasticadhaerens]QDV38072.1 Deoxyuridine 5'-triphosphate nucleotidohydrolase [Tautonia plasticadhaerens]